jgi:hypothetical protein
MPIFPTNNIWGNLMFSKKSNNLIFLLFLAIFSMVLALPGCKEGTEQSPVSSLLTSSDLSGKNAFLPDNADTTTGNQIAGHVVSKTSQENLTNIEVNLYYNQNLVTTTRTTSEGKFFFYGLPSGLYDLTLAPDNSTYATHTAVIQILNDGTLSPSNPVFELSNLVSSGTGEVKVNISGYIKDQSDSSAINNISVELYKKDALGNFTRQQTAYTSAEGKFFFQELTQGSYRLEAGKESPVFSTSTANMTILSDGTVSPPNPVIFLSERPAEENFTLTGFVKTQTKEVLANIRVDIRKGASDAENSEWTYTTGEGKFFFQNLTSGMYYLQANIGKTTLESDIYPVRILSDGTMSPTVAEIFVPQNKDNETVNIKGNIYDAFTGGPLEYAKVLLEGYSNNLTDTNGEFSFTELLPGIYKLVISKAGFQTLEASFQINENGDPVTTPSALSYPLIHVERTGYGSIAGRFVDIDTEEGISGKLVTLANYKLVTKKSGNVTETDWEITGRVLTTRTLEDDPETPQNEKGSFKLTHLAPTDETVKYAIYIGNDEPTYINEARDNSIFTWKVFNSAGTTSSFAVYGFSVASAQTTFWTNYEHTKMD